jgi:hypothetical protein
MGLNADNQRATAAGAFGGDRQSVLNSLTDQNYQRTLAGTDANLNYQNFMQAQAGATGDPHRVGASHGAA